MYIYFNLDLIFLTRDFTVVSPDEYLTIFIPTYITLDCDLIAKLILAEHHF
jgi:hypothetical protein